MVEPDKILGDSAVDTLKLAGHKVTWRRNAQSALDVLDSDLPEVIILELQLGIHNGIEFLYEMRSYIEWQNIPVIVYTLNANVLDERFNKPFKQLGVQAVLYKPRSNLRRLSQAVGQLLPI